MKDITRISRSFLHKLGIKEVFQNRNSIMKVVINYLTSEDLDASKFKDTTFTKERITACISQQKYKLGFQNGQL